MFKLPHPLQFVKVPSFYLILHTLSAYVGPIFFWRFSFKGSDHFKDFLGKLFVVIAVVICMNRVVR